MSPNSIDDQNASETGVSASGTAQAIATFRLPHYGMLWSSNLIQFICFHVLFLAMQWLLTSPRSPSLQSVVNVADWSAQKTLQS